MLFICRSSSSIQLIIFLIICALFSTIKSYGNERFFNGLCTRSFIPCQHACVPNPTNLRQYYCTCRSGYFIQNDGFSCNKTPPKDLEMQFEIHPGINEEKDKKFIPRNTINIKKSTRKLVTREKRYTGAKYETIKPKKGLPKGKCNVNSCKNGGVCQTMKSSSNYDFVISCLCRLGFEGVTCEIATVGVRFPKFLNGYLAFPEQILNDLNFRLSLYVRPANDSQADTVIAFKQSFKNNNFILGLEQNYFIFKIGTDKSQKKYKHHIKLENERNKWYKIEIERKDNEGKLLVNDTESLILPKTEIRQIDEEKYSDNKKDSNVQQNNFICDNCLYLGGHSQLMKTVERNPNLFDSIETSFIGCMRNLVIDEVDIDMRRMPFYGKAVDGLGIEDCSAGLCDSKTKGITCQNNGDCQISQNFESTCHCRFRYIGKFCEQEINIQIPLFTGESYANYNGLKETSRSQNDIFIKFKPASGTGILFYQGYSSDKRGDFLALYLINGYPWVSYDLGSGTITMRSKNSLMLDEWHTMRFYRIGRKGTLIIDYGEPVVGFSPGSQLQLTIKQNLQLGGVDSFDNVSAFLNIRKGFQGCINMLYVDHVRINLINDILLDNSRNLQNCDSHQCGQYRKICWKGGECIPINNLYVCLCPLGYIEENCQTEIEISGIRQPSFNGSSYLAYNNTKLLKKFSNSKFKLSIVVNFKAIQNQRILMQMISKSEMNIGQFFTLQINSNSGINLDLNNGVDKIETDIINNLPLFSDHRIEILKDDNLLQFTVNNSFAKTIKLKYKNLSLFGFAKLFFGGTDPITAIRMNLPMQSGIVGCLKEINVDNQKIKVFDAVDGRSVAECSSRYLTNSESLESRPDLN